MAYYVARFSLFLGGVIYNSREMAFMYQHPLRLLLLGSGPPGFFGRGMVLSPVKRESSSVDIAWWQTRGGKGEMKLDGHEDPSIHDGCRLVSSWIVRVSMRVCKILPLGYVQFRRITLVQSRLPRREPHAEGFNKDLTSSITKDSQW